MTLDNNELAEGRTVRAVKHLAHYIRAATIELQEKIMSVLSDYAAKVESYTSGISDDLDAISAQIAALNATITTLNNSAGQVTPEDQASIDKALAQLTTLAAKADSAAGKTPPPTP